MIQQLLGTAPEHSLKTDRVSGHPFSPASLGRLIAVDRYTGRPVHHYTSVLTRCSAVAALLRKR
jgi:hypothetical protein